jgi:hypothetical protein
MVARWRHLDDDFGDKFKEPSFNGPAIAVNFRW